MSNVYFGLGSNLGDRLQNLRDALSKLSTLGNIERVSKVYETPAWGGVPQPDYLNACVKVECEEKVSPPELLSVVKTFEHELGREPSIRWGARKIDIDILLIDDEVYHSDELDIPHIRIPERLFVLVPLKDILPEGWRHPVNGKTVQEMITALEGEAWPVMRGEL
ncbi:MAG: 2-amino-4-hydroxy-6-hydroxymethyldihydropteridine diphosphokinase [Synergistaceae bacterium]|nr:2-amino-4-hydroxy-6-hydroxymethyldihydropteridine diphosphokinase [Synergistaceae bacterium]